MAAPELIFSTSGERLSAAEGFDRIAVTVHASLPCRTIECRATKAGEEYGVGKGTLLASFSSTPANTPRTFEIYDDFLLRGDGQYRISLFAQGEDGSWNDNYPYVPVGEGAYRTADQTVYLCMRE